MFEHGTPQRPVLYGKVEIGSGHRGEPVDRNLAPRRIARHGHCGFEMLLQFGEGPFVNGEHQLVDIGHSVVNRPDRAPDLHSQGASSQAG